MNEPFNYPFEARPLAPEEGGGWLISFPDLPGCMFDGETPEEAMANGKDALGAWLGAMREAGKPIPDPGKPASGKFIARATQHPRAPGRTRARKA